MNSPFYLKNLRWIVEDIDYFMYIEDMIWYDIVEDIILSGYCVRVITVFTHVLCHKKY